MGRLVLGVSSLLSIVALALAGFGVATNHWVRLHRPDGAMNPVEVNAQMAFTTIKYPARYFGLWYGCYRYVDERARVVPVTMVPLSWCLLSVASHRLRAPPHPGSARSLFRSVEYCT